MVAWAPQALQFLLPCPSSNAADCSGLGTCSAGVCQCRAPSPNPDCSSPYVAPVISPTGLPNASSLVTLSSGQLYQVSPSLSSGTLPVSWSLAQGPTGMTVNATTGALQWTAAALSGPATVTIVATNLGGSATYTWQLSVPLPYTASAVVTGVQGGGGAMQILSGVKVFSSPVPVRMEGQARPTPAQGAVAPGSPVLVLLRDSSGGIRDTITVRTNDTEGRFTAVFLALPLDVGAFHVFALHPLNLSYPGQFDTPQDSFQILGLSVDFNYTLLSLTAQGPTLTLPATGVSTFFQSLAIVTNIGSFPLSRLQLTVLSSAPQLVSVAGASLNTGPSASANASLNGSQAAPCDVTLLPSAASASQGPVRLTISVSSAEGASATATLFLQPALPQPRVSRVCLYSLGSGF